MSMSLSPGGRRPPRRSSGNPANSNRRGHHRRSGRSRLVENLHGQTAISTGFSIVAPDWAEKASQLLKEIVPNLVCGIGASECQESQSQIELKEC